MPDLVALIASRARALRAEQHLTIEQLSQRSGLSPEMISRIERHRVAPSVRTLERVARGLGVPLTTLFTEDAVAVVSAEGIPVEVRGLALLLAGRPPALVRKVRRIVEVLLDDESELAGVGG